ncbi:MAG: hypothetical protein JWM43_2028 [Acidobacteriaceae bacterium]|nr:hypothetical protein [Acidobacteriaceae bacterium]
MADILLPAASVLFFLAAIGYTVGCERLNTSPTSRDVVAKEGK